MSAGFFAFPLIVASVPQFRDYDPVQKPLFNLFNIILGQNPSYPFRLLIKILCSCYYLGAFCHGACAVYTMMLFICIVMVEACLYLSAVLLPSKHFKPKLQYRKCVYIYRLLQILIQIEYWIIHTFLTVLVTMGTLITACGGYVMLVMYDEFPLVMYLSCSVIFFFCIAVNILLVTLAGIPNKNGQLFKDNFNKLLRMKQDRMVLRSCPEIGFTLGCVKPVKFHTALEIMNLMISCTLSLVLSTK